LWILDEVPKVSNNWLDGKTSGAASGYSLRQQGQAHPIAVQNSGYLIVPRKV
jgi:hypothetical protein